jgi:hypothetical protein
MLCTLKGCVGSRLTPARAVGRRSNRAISQQHAKTRKTTGTPRKSVCVYSQKLITERPSVSTESLILIETEGIKELQHSRFTAYICDISGSHGEPCWLRQQAPLLTSVNFHQTKRRNTPEDSYVHHLLCSLILNRRFCNIVLASHSPRGT